MVQGWGLFSFSFLPPHTYSCHSVAKLYPTLCDPKGGSTPGFPVFHHLLEFAQSLVHWVSPSNHLILCHPFLLLSLIFPSIRVFSNESALCIRWPKYWSFSFSISPFNEYSRLISFRIDWFDLLAVQGTLKSLLQKELKASVLQRSAFFMVQLTLVHDYWKNHSLDYMTLGWWCDVSAF